MLEGIFLAGRCVFAHGGVVVVVGTRYRWWTKSECNLFLLLGNWTRWCSSKQSAATTAVCCRLRNCEERTLLYACSGAYYLEAAVTLETNERQCQGQQRIEQASILQCITLCSYQTSNRTIRACSSRSTYVTAAQRACFIHTSVWRWRFLKRCIKYILTIFYVKPRKLCRFPWQGSYNTFIFFYKQANRWN